MHQKKSLVLKLAAFLLFFITAPGGGCGFGVLGEPELPAKMQRP